MYPSRRDRIRNAWNVLLGREWIDPPMEPGSFARALEVIHLFADSQTVQPDVAGRWKAAALRKASNY